MYDRCNKAVALALKREAVLAAQEQYKSLQLDAQPISVPQPSDRERELHDLTHVPFQPWCKYCVMSRSKADHHSHAPDPAGEAQREFATIQCDFSSWNQEKKVQLLHSSWWMFGRDMLQLPL